MTRLVTPDELLRMPDGDGYELIDGVPRPKPAGALASWIAGHVITALVTNVRERRLGHVYGATAGYHCFPGRPNHVLVPDVSFVAAGRLPGDRSPKGYIEIPPDLVAEVVDPVEPAWEIEEKVADYRTIGLRLMWIVYPGTRTVLVRRLDRTCTELCADDTLTGEDVLPGFAVKVAEFFA